MIKHILLARLTFSLLLTFQNGINAFHENTSKQQHAMACGHDGQRELLKPPFDGGREGKNFYSRS